MVSCDACASAADALRLNCRSDRRRERSDFDVDMAANMRVGVVVVALGTAEDCTVGEGVLEMGRADSRTEDLVAVDVRMNFSVVASERMMDLASSFPQADKLVVQIVEVCKGPNLVADTEGIRSQDVTTLFALVVGAQDM